MKSSQARSVWNIGVLARLSGRLRRPGLYHRTTPIALAMLLVLSPPLWAATIIVDETTCTLVDAITSANTDTATGGCPAGWEWDTIELTTDVMLYEEVESTYQCNLCGLPPIQSQITIEGEGFMISRDPSGPVFRLLRIDSDGTLTLNDVTLLFGHLDNGSGGGIVNDGTLTLINQYHERREEKLLGGPGRRGQRRQLGPRGGGLR